MSLFYKKELSQIVSLQNSKETGHEESNHDLDTML
jgi:hypothetical protein